MVNAFSAGIMKKGTMISATASGVGNPVFIVGSSTGKDGINGAAFASMISLVFWNLSCIIYKYFCIV